MKNLVEILRNAPRGLELYSPVYGKVKLDDVQEHSIYVTNTKGKSNIWFSEEGKLTEDGECCIFPSEDFRTWVNWQFVLFKEGYFITYMGKYTLITSKVPKGGFPKEDDYLSSRFATKREIEIYNQCKSREIIHNIEEKPFTIDDFKPFDKVLVRDCYDPWSIQIFSHYTRKSQIMYHVIGDYYNKCVPYNDETKYLLGTKQEYNGKYKTW